MRLLLLSLFLFFSCELLYSQESAITDSLIREVNLSESDEKKVDVLIDLYIYYHTKNSDSALHYAEKAFQLANEINYLEGQIVAITNIGSVSFYNGDLGNALKSYLKSNELVDNYIKKYSKDDFAKRQLSKSLNNIGLVYLKQQKFEEAENYLLQSLEIDLKLGNLASLSNCYNNLGAVNENLNNYEKAIEYYTKAYNIKLKEKNKSELSSTLINIGVIRMNEQSFYEADTCFNSAVKYSKKAENYRDLCIAYINLGDLYYTQRKFDNALTYYFLALDICEEHNYLYFLSYTYESISLVYLRKNNYKGAYDYYVLFTETKDKINSDENQKLINEIQTKYETEKKEKEISLLNKEKDLKDIELKNSKTFLIYTVLGLILISSFLILLFFSYKQKQKINAEVQIKNKKLETAYNIVEEKNKEILDSITYAKRLQDAILPSTKVVKSFLMDSFILYKPKDIVAGDFYFMDVIEDSDSNRNKKLIYYVAADCTGHGVPGAMVSIVGANGLRRCIQEFGLREPGKILDQLSELVAINFSQSEERIRDGMDLALCCLEVINDQIKRVHYAGANNPLWVINPNRKEIPENVNSFKEGRGFEIKANKQAIGYTENIKPFDTHIIELEPGDTLYTFSDGYSDQFGGSENNKGGKKLKSANFRKMLFEIQDKTMDEQLSILDKRFEEWRGDIEQLDDVCIIGVRI